MFIKLISKFRQSWGVFIAITPRIDSNFEIFANLFMKTSTEKIQILGAVAMRNPDQPKITIGVVSSSHEVTFDLYKASLDDILKFVGKELRITIEVNQEREELTEL